MPYYFITCRSLTYAQRSIKVLERGGITCYMLRTPKHIAREGCGYGVKLVEKNIQNGLQLLKKADLSPRQIFFSENGRDLKEVTL